MKTVRIFSDRIRDRIRLKGFRSVRIRVRIFNIRYRIHIRILKSHIYDVDIQSYLIRYSWHCPYSNSNSNPDRNIKTNVISTISVRSVFMSIPSVNANARPNATPWRTAPRVHVGTGDPCHPSTVGSHRLLQRRLLPHLTKSWGSTWSVRWENEEYRMDHFSQPVRPFLFREKFSRKLL